jgi:hypothetical protein
MLNSMPTRVTLVGALAVALVAATFSSASAAEPNGSAEPLYLLDSNDGSPIPYDRVFDFNDGVIASPDRNNVEALFTGPEDATETIDFLSPRGSERDITKWTATGAGGFYPDTKNVLQPSMNLGGLTNGGGQGAKATGGKFSLGIAFTLNNGVTIASIGPSYIYITIQPGGAWTFDGPSTPADGAGGTADIPLSAEVAAPAPATDGALSLVVPAGSAATIGAPSLVDGISTSTGSLPDFTVKDARALTHKGWTLTSKVSDFVSGETKIPAAQLTVSPKVKSTTATGVVAAASAAASNTDVPFAAADDSATVGDTVLNADLTFVAPSKSTPAGTYTSKMTLTLVSK